jgi:hypothetical protein
MRTPSPAARRLLPALAAALLAACGDASGPPPTNDPVVLVGRMRVIDSIVADRLIQSNNALGLAFRPARDASGVLADSLYGRTFEWDLAADRYVLTARRGAPADAVRHVLYRIQGGAPAQPLTELGTTDLRPLSGSTPAVRSVVTGGGGLDGSGADLRVSALLGSAGAVIDAAGTVRSAGRRADVRGRFEVAPDLVTVDVAVDVPGRALATRAIVRTRYFAGGARQEADLRLHTMGEVMTMAGWVERVDFPGGASYEADLTLYLNGAVLATIIGTDETIRFRDADGAVLTGDLALALNAFFRAPGTLHASVAAMMQPGVNFLSGT